MSLPKRVSLNAVIPSSEETSGNIRKRVSISSILDEVQVVNSVPHLQESLTQINLVSTIPIKECSGIEGVVITPPYMEFKDGCEGLTMEQTLTLQNLGDKIVTVKIKNPNSMSFQIKPTPKTGCKLCPGLCLNKIVRYSYKVPSSTHAMIPIEINGTVLDYHLICVMSHPQIVVKPAVLEFEYVDIGSVSDIKKLIVTNAGHKSARFSVDFGQDFMEINVQPTKGMIRPNSSLVLYVQVTGTSEGIFCKELWIKSYPNVRVAINFKVIQPKLVINNFTARNDYTLLNFPTIFTETQKHVTFTLKNVSSQTASFVLFNDDNGNLTNIKEMNIKENPVFDAFRIQPLEGVLQPFEDKVFNITFRPTLKALRLFQKEMKNQYVDYFAAVVKICKMKINEAKEIIKMETSTNMDIEKRLSKLYMNDSLSEENEKVLPSSDAHISTEATIYLYGKVEIAQLNFTPSALYLGDLKIGDKIERKIRIENLSRQLSLVLSFVHKPCIKCEPAKAYLTPGGAVEVLVSVKAEYSLTSPFKLEFDALSESADAEDLKKTKNVRFARFVFPCDYNPIQAPVKIKKPSTICKTSSWNGLPLEPDYSLTYTTSEFELRMKHREYWTQYFREIFSRADKIHVVESEKSWCDESLDDFCDLMKIPVFKDKSVAREALTRYLESKCEKDKERFSKALSPVDVFKVHVFPLKLDFGKVSLKIRNQSQLTFENKNFFPVLISLISLHPRYISFPGGHDIFLPPEATVSRPVEFHSEHYGKYSSYINYTVNRVHKYQLPFVANTLPKNIELPTKEIIFDKDNHPQEGYRAPFQIIELKNKLNVGTRFKWKIPPNSNFTIEPIVGEIPGNQQVFLAAYQQSDPSKINRAEAVLHVEDGGRHVLQMEAAMRSPGVFLTEESIDVGEIPLNVEYHVRSVLCNSEYQPVSFEIDEDSVMKGLCVQPTSGVLPARGIVILNIRLKFDACIECWTIINVVVQKRLVLQLRINFTVVFPKLKLKPSIIEMKRLSSNSHRVQEVFFTNLTNVKITLRFPLDEYPEFSLSRSMLKKDSLIGKQESVEIPAQSTIKFYLHFAPCDLASYSFYLPMIVNELLGPATNDDDNFKLDEFLTSNADSYLEFSGVTVSTIPTKLSFIHVLSTVARPDLCFNKLLFEFDDILWHEFQIYNVSETSLSIILVTESLTNTHDRPFAIKPKNDKKNRKIEPKNTNDRISFELLANHEISFEIKFEPKTRGRWSFELPIVLKIDEIERQYNSLVINGFYSAQCIETDVLEVYLVPMPLNVTSKETFTLKMNSFAKSTSICTKICVPDNKYCGTFDANAIEILFPNGNAVKAHCSHEILIEIKFKSPVPVSFCARVIFSDIDNTTSTSILIYGSVDNCILSTYIYGKMDNFLLTRTNKYPAELLNEQDNMKKKSCKLKPASTTSSQNYIFYKRDSEGQKLHDEPHYRKSLNHTMKKDNYSDLDLTIQSSCESLIPPRSFYPFFPSHDSLDPTHKKSYMNRTLESVEKWLYAYALRYQFNPTLIDGIAVALSGIRSIDTLFSTDKNKNNSLNPCTFIDILECLLDSEEISDINLRLKEREYESDDERIIHILETYQEILRYLLSIGVYVAHVMPEFLLEYNDYATSKNIATIDKSTVQTTDYTLPEYSFRSRSKQTWLDIILQSYKCFVSKQVNKITLESHVARIKSSKSIDSELHYCELNADEIIKKSKKRTGRCKSEAILLSWLEHCHNKIFAVRSINDFEDCLSDGLPFIAATMAYCPLLKKEFFNNIFTKPSSFTQKMHNIVCLVLAWKKIRLGFIVTPSEILNPNCVQMLMLSVHLFQKLPTYLIINKISLSCPLTKSTTQPIKLSIAINDPINYVVEVIDNDINLFTSKSIVTIYPRKNKQIKITYHARKIHNAKAYLIMCGSAIGPHFAENQVFVLEGLVSELEISDTQNLRSKLYQIVDKTLAIAVPYNYQIEYDIWLSDQLPKDPSELKINRWSDLKTDKLPRRLLINNRSLSIMEENSQVANLSVTIACITCESRSFWIIFQSDLADFIVQINSSCKSSITDHDSIEIAEDECVCLDLPKQMVDDCPMSKNFFIRAKNVQMHNFLLRSFQRSLTENENTFWIQHLNNCIGLHFINCMMKNAGESVIKDFKHVFNSKVTYNVTFNKKADILVCPRSITIEDVQNNDNKVELKLHVREVNTELKSALVTLTSLDKKEIRVCQVNFLYEESIASEPQTKQNKYQTNYKNSMKRCNL